MILPTPDEMAFSICNAYDRATSAQREAGRAWYPLAGAIVKAIAERLWVDPERVTFVLAALSPRNPWRWNVMDAHTFMLAAVNGQPMPSCSTFPRNRLAAWAVATGTGGDPWVTTARKVRAFVRAINSDENAVVVDAWAMRVVTDGNYPSGSTVSDSQYDAVVAAYRRAARMTGETPAALQAITWLVAQAAGTGSRRKGRHDLSFKRGTPQFLVDMLS